MTRDEAITEIRGLARTCRGPINAESAAVRNALLEDDRLDEARDEDAAGRPGCGFDFNNIVCEGPFDGKPHAYECPRCGVQGTYTAPRFELEEG